MSWAEWKVHVFIETWIPWNLSFHYIFISLKRTPNDAVTPLRQSQFTPKMKANAVPRLLSSLVWIDQYNQCNGLTSFMEFIRGENCCLPCLRRPTTTIHVSLGSENVSGCKWFLKRDKHSDRQSKEENARKIRKKRKNRSIHYMTKKIHVGKTNCYYKNMENYWTECHPIWNQLHHRN